MLQKKGNLIKVEWLDAFSIDDWTNVDNIQIKPCPIISVGIVIEHTIEHLVIALSHDTFNDNYSCFKSIPSGMITHIKKLK